jgi:two-component system response regulator DevR
MGGTTARRSTPLPSAEERRSKAPIVLRAGDPPDLVVQRRGLELAHEGLRVDRRRSRSVIADVHAVTRHGMRLLCDMCGGVEVVAEASSPGEVVRVVLESESNLVVLGFEPPDLIRRLCNEAPFTKVLVMSPRCDEPDILRALGAGASAYVSKSVSPEEFKAAVETARAGGVYLDVAMADALRSALERVGGSKSRARARLGDLTHRETEIARLLSEGLTARSIGNRLGISDRTVSTHVGSLYRRLGVNNRVDAVRELIRRGLTPTPR